MPKKEDGTPQKLLFILLAALLLPSAAGLTFKQAVMSRPWKAAGLLAAYEALLLVLAFVGKIWRHLENRWATEFATALAAGLERTFTTYEKRYLEHISFAHRFFDVKGLGTQGIFTLHMEQVFVDLSIVPQSPQNVPPNPLGNLREIVPGKRYSIHDFLTAEWLRNPNLAILGPPGSGKTTLLKHVALTLAGKKVAPKFRKIPILIFLREHVALIQKGVSLPDIVDHSMVSVHCPPPPCWFKGKIEKGRCIVMFDGLDEIPDRTIRKAVAKWVDDQIKGFPRSRFMLTSRPFGYQSNPLEGGVTVFEVRPFSAHQVRRFVHNWYLANESMAAGETADRGVTMAASKGAEDLLGRLRKNQDLAELAVNPLLLTMISTVHRFKSSLPGKRVELYSEMCDVFLGNRQRAKSCIELGDTDLMPGQKRRVLQPLAYQMMRQRDRHIRREHALAAIRSTLALVSRTLTPEQFLKDVEDFSGVLLEKENGVYSFAHLTFQEYLAAAHIRSHRLEDEVLNRIDDSWWHETLRLYSAQGDASPIIRACLSSDRPSIEALTLATQCMDEAFEVDPQLANRLERVLSATKAQDVQRLVAKQRLKLRVRKLMRSDESFLLDDSLVTVAEYQLFLLDMAAKGAYRFGPDHWSGDDYLSESAARPIEGVRGTDAEAFCTWLTEREANDCAFRIPDLGEAMANPLLLAAQNTPLHYWVSGTERRSLVAASETSGPYVPDLLHRSENDLEVLLSKDLALAGAVEWARESWPGAGRLRSSVRDRVAKDLRLGPSIDIDAIVSSEVRDIFGSGNAVLLSRAAVRAASCELSRSIELDALDRYLKSSERCLELREPTKEEMLGANIVWRLVISDPSLEIVATPGSEWTPRMIPFADRIRDYSKRLGTDGAPLQDRYFRSHVAATLCLPLFGDRIRQAPASTAYGSYKESTDDSALRRRALIRVLCLVSSRLLIGPERSVGTVRETEAESRADLARLLLQTFVDLTILEERISGSAPATECIRITRQRNLDTLAAAYLQEEAMETAKDAVAE
jgi:NACHT domain